MQATTNLHHSFQSKLRSKNGALAPEGREQQQAIG